MERHLSDADFQLVFEVRIQNYLWAIELLALPLLNVRRCVHNVYNVKKMLFFDLRNSDLMNGDTSVDRGWTRLKITET